MVGRQDKDGVTVINGVSPSLCMEIADFRLAGNLRVLCSISAAEPAICIRTMRVLSGSASGMPPVCNVTVWRSKTESVSS